MMCMNFKFVMRKMPSTVPTLKVKAFFFLPNADFQLLDYTLS